jgi:uncharacterized protein YgiM (DUF1202 family)
MKKMIWILLALLALVVLCGVAGMYAITANAKGNPAPIATATARSSPTAHPDTCTVRTGIDKGTVNLRACKGAACGKVLDTVTEGESLTIVTTSEWMHVTTARGVAGWLNRKYCKEDK